jgi:hypothetical protein
MTSSTTDSHADVQHLCRLAGVPRTTYYRRLGRQDSKAAECELRDLIQSSQWSMLFAVIVATGLATLHIPSRRTAPRLSRAAG